MLERAKGLEPSTSTLARSRSTTELRPRVGEEGSQASHDGQRIGAYDKSKTIAERAAWEYMASIKGDSPMEISVVNPGNTIRGLTLVDLGKIFRAKTNSWPGGKSITIVLRDPGSPLASWIR